MEIWGFFYFFLFSLLIFCFFVCFFIFFLFFNFYFIFLTSSALCKKMTFSALYKTPTLRTPTLTSLALCKNKLNFSRNTNTFEKWFFFYFFTSLLFLGSI